MVVCWSLIPGVLKVPIRTLHRLGAAGRPLRPARAGPWPRRASPSTSQVPAGASSTDAVHRGPVLADQRHPALGVDRHDGHRPGVMDDEALEGPAVGIEHLGLAHGEESSPGTPPPRRPGGTRERASSGTGLGHAIEIEQVRLAPLGPVQRRRHQLAEQGVGPVGPALELRVGLGADPERVLAQLDELDQAPVGRACPSRPGRPPRAGAGTCC